MRSWSSHALVAFTHSLLVTAAALVSITRLGSSVPRSAAKSSARVKLPSSFGQACLTGMDAAATASLLAQKFAARSTTSSRAVKPSTCVTSAGAMALQIPQNRDAENPLGVDTAPADGEAAAAAVVRVATTAIRSVKTKTRHAGRDRDRHGSVDDMSRARKEQVVLRCVVLCCVVGPLRLHAAPEEREMSGGDDDTKGKPQNPLALAKK